jgi:AraC family transcriptional regulator
MPADGSRASAPSSVRLLAQGQGWRVSDVVCARGPRDRRFEEQHAGVSLAAVLSGTFQYRSTHGRALLHPGAVLLGNAGDCFECGHEHGVGDRCLAFHFVPEYFEEIAFGSVGDARFRLGLPMLPALRRMAAPLLRVQARLHADEPGATDEAVLQFAEAVLRSLADSRGEPAVAARDQRRIGEVVRHIERHADAPLDLDRLARLACMSKFHFLRSFRRTLGVTPHQFLLQQRLRNAALALRARPDERIATIAADAGFGDLSTFNALFRDVFGSSPRAFRDAR